jgi:hypothetical protein
MQAQVGGDRLLGVAVRLDHCRDAGMPRVPVAPRGRAAQRWRFGISALHACPRIWALRQSAKGASPSTLRAPVSPQRPGLPPRADQRAIARLRRGPARGELPSFPPPVTWHTAPGYAMWSGRAMRAHLPSGVWPCQYNRPDPVFTVFKMLRVYMEREPVVVMTEDVESVASRIIQDMQTV